MRDVTNSFEPHFDEIKNHFKYLLQFLRNPVQEITRLPDWKWTNLLLVLWTVAVCSGVIAGLLPMNPYHILSGLIIFPVISSTMNFLTGLVIHYFFQFFLGQVHSFRRIFTLVFFANLPFYVFEMGAKLVPFLTLLGFGVTAFLLIVGLVSNFQLDRKLAMKLVGAIYAVVFITWVLDSLIR